MKICVAQTKPVMGDLQRNIDYHKLFIDHALLYHADCIIFPELSLTGYEPTLAQALAIKPDDPRLDIFQTLADGGQITIGVGAPTQNQPRPCISLVLLRPHAPRQTYAKQYLFPTENAYFTSGPHTAGLIGDNLKMALAICYELSVPEHAADAFKNGAEIYIASVAKVAQGVDNANKRLAEIAKQYAMAVFMANCVGLADGDVCAGGTAVWNYEGRLLGQLDDTNEGILIFDTNTQDFIQEIIMI